MVAEAASKLNVPRGDLIDGLERKLNEFDDLRSELASLRSKLAVAQSGDLVAKAENGVVVARVDGVGRDEL